MPINLDTTNMWLAVMALTIVVQTLLLIGIAFAAYQGLQNAAVAANQAMQKATEALQGLEDRHLVPLSAQVTAVSARVTAVADDVQEVMGRVRRADDAVRVQLSRLDNVANVANVAGQAITNRVWPVVGLSRAVAAALRAFSSRSSTPSSATPRVARVPIR